MFYCKTCEDNFWLPEKVAAFLFSTSCSMCWRVNEICKFLTTHTPRSIIDFIHWREVGDETLKYQGG